MNILLLYHLLPAKNLALLLRLNQLGDFSNKVHKIKIGDSAYIDGSYGSFSYLKKNNINKLCFLAGDSN